MPEFDVYRKWLGIPSEEQPPNLYRLLGVGLFETDADVIANAADRQMAHVRTFQTGQHSALSQKLLNELAAARITLLDAKRRATYDETLRAQRATAEPAGVASSSAVPPPFFDPASDDENSDPLDLSPPPFSPALAGYTAARRRKKSRQGPLVAAGVALATLILLVWLVLSGTYKQFLPDSPSNAPKAAEKSARAAPSDAHLNETSTSSARQPLVTHKPPPPLSDAASAAPPAERRDPPKLVQKPLPQKRAPILQSKAPDEADSAPSPSATETAPAGDTSLPEDPESKPEDVLGLLPLPEEAAQKKAEETIRKSLFPHDFEAAERSGRHEALAKKLLEEGLATTEDPPATFVLLKLAAIESAAAGDIETTFAAFDALAQRFQPTPLEFKMNVVESLAKAAKLTAAQRVLLATRMLETTSDAAEREQYELADRALALARQLSSKARDPALVKEVANRGKRLQESKQAYQKVEQSLKTIESSPDDVGANEIVGRYYCFTKGNWQRGLKYLVAVDDQGLRDLAKRDLASPKAGAQRLALADDWWDLSETQHGLARQTIRQRAAYWYKQIEGLTGLNQSKVRHRLAEIANGEDDERGLPAGPTTKTAPLECRSLAARPALLKRFGGNVRTELAVDRALAWLDKHQNLDGSWNFNHHGPRCKDLCPDPGLLDAAPNAATAIVLLAFLGNGNSPKEGRYRKNVLAAVAFLKKRSTVIGGAAVLFEPKATRMPSHALATTAFCEAATLSRDRQLRLCGQSLVNFIVASQTLDGGWSERLPMGQHNSTLSMSPSGPSSMLATVWSLTALRTAQWAGLTVPARSFQQANRFLERDRGHAPDEQTLEAYGCLFVDWPPSREVKLGAEVEWSPALGGRWFQNYCQAVCLKQTVDAAWDGWNAGMRDHLLESQAKEGHVAGSWYSDGGDWCDRQGGRLFCTAMGALILETYYRYPVLQ